MADLPMLGLCADCLYERHQKVEAVTLFAGTSVCSACNDTRQLDARLGPGRMHPIDVRDSHARPVDPVQQEIQRLTGDL